MIVEKRHLDGFTLLNVEGVIKLGESAQFFAQTLERALSDDHGHVIIDFSKINFIDSTGIGELVGYLGRFRNSQRELILVNPSDRIRKLLQVARLAELFPTYDIGGRGARRRAVGSGSVRPCSPASPRSSATACPSPGTSGPRPPSTPEGRLVASARRSRGRHLPALGRQAVPGLPLLLAGGDERFGLDARRPRPDLRLARRHPEHVAAGRGPARPRRLRRRGPPLRRPPAPRQGERAADAAGGERAHAAAQQLLGQARRACSSPAGCWLPDRRTTSPRTIRSSSASWSTCRSSAACPREQIGFGIDGCSVPAYHMPLAAAARGYAALADPARGRDCRPRWRRPWTGSRGP